MGEVNFGVKLKELRIKRGHGQKELGKFLGVGAPQVARYESNDVLPDHDKVKLLCKLYEYDFVSLIYDIPRPTPVVQPDEFREKYLNLLERENSQKSQIIGVNLTALQIGQQSILANIEAGLELSIEWGAEGNRKKVDSMKKELDRRIGEKLGVLQHKGSSANT